MQTKSKPKVAQPVVGTDLVSRRLNSSFDGNKRGAFVLKELKNIAVM
jgi:hypothetical protein